MCLFSWQILLYCFHPMYCNSFSGCLQSLIAIICVNFETPWLSSGESGYSVYVCVHMCAWQPILCEPFFLFSFSCLSFQQWTSYWQSRMLTLSTEKGTLSKLTSLPPSDLIQYICGWCSYTRSSALKLGCFCYFIFTFKITFIQIFLVNTQVLLICVRPAYPIDYVETVAEEHFVSICWRSSV